MKKLIGGMVMMFVGSAVMFAGYDFYKAGVKGE